MRVIGAVLAEAATISTAAWTQVERSDQTCGAGEAEAVEHFEEADRLAVAEGPDVDLRRVQFLAVMLVAPVAAADPRKRRNGDNSTRVSGSCRGYGRVHAKAGSG